MSFLLNLLVLIIATSYGQDVAPSFLDGVKAYQQKDFTKAQAQLSLLAQEHPNNPTLLYNLGLAEFQLGNSGLALGLWRKARSLDNSLSSLDSAISYTEELLFPQQRGDSVFQSLYSNLTKVPIHFWLLLSLATLFALLWFTIEYGAKQKKAILEWPNFIFLLPLLVFFCCTVSALMLADQMQMKATVVQKNVLTHANPSESSPTLSELQEGQIVKVHKSHSGWIQIVSLNGAPGWVRQETLLAFGGF